MYVVMKEMPGNPACEDCENMIKFVVVICQQRNLRGFQSKKDSYQRKCMMIFQKQKLKLNLFKNQAPFTGVVGPLPNGPFFGRYYLSHRIHGTGMFTLHLP